MTIPYFDAHCDTLYRCETCGDDLNELQKAYFAATQGLRENRGHIDLRRASAYAPCAQFFAIFGDTAELPRGTAWEYTQRLHDRFLREMDAHGDMVGHCRTGAEIDDAVKNGKIAALLCVEGADLLDCDLEKLDIAAGWGIRFLNPVWNNPNRLSGTNCADADRGLSPQGAEFIRRMEQHRIFADVSHISDAGFWDLVHMTKAPIVASHSDSRTLCPHPRNLTDDMFLAIRDTGGVVGINFYRDFVGGDRMDDLIAHVEHFLDLGGENTVCLGGDLDGCETLAAGMRGIEDVGKLYEALQNRGYGEELLKKIFWSNLRNLL